MDDHEHEWQLTENGYTRTWSTRFRADGTIVATFDGSSDFSEEGDGDMHLTCRTCLARRELTEEEVNGIEYW